MTGWERLHHHAHIPTGRNLRSGGAGRGESISILTWSSELLRRSLHRKGMMTLGRDARIRAVGRSAVRRELTCQKLRETHLCPQATAHQECPQWTAQNTLTKRHTKPSCAEHTTALPNCIHFPTRI
ncbi:hypothetical protein MPH_04356 [Macrophomina phaseolina MS6]|uniref:Uncharacterized protein n=1 Tax=Macrophomina phaseolina (strain MS6) TaxID=1126212 RepID=K2SNH1_MACPH|nr:hypothetical protein MPH_04356 [Macrophomina phaseolina MS6]